MNEYRQFLHAHFKQPFDDSTMLVWADWLEDRGDPYTSELLRLAVSGHDAMGGPVYYARTQRLLMVVYHSFRKVYIDDDDQAFDFCRSRWYQVKFNGIIMHRRGPGPACYLRQGAWTPKIVAVATYVILNRLTETPDIETWLPRPSGLAKKQLYQALVQLFRTLNRVVTCLLHYSLAVGGELGPDWEYDVIGFFVEHLQEIMQALKLAKLFVSRDSTDGQMIIEMAMRCFGLLDELDDVTDGYGGPFPISQTLRLSLYDLCFNRM